MDIDTVIAFWVKWCLPSFVVVMLGVGYFGAGLSEGEAQMRVADACQNVRMGATGTVTITRGNTSRTFKC